MVTYVFCANPEHPDMADAWRKEFADVDNVEFVVQDIFAVECDGIVSPANSFGDMSGGLDYFINSHYDGMAEPRTQHMLGVKFKSMGYMPVGCARIVDMFPFQPRYLAVVPTMQNAGEILDRPDNKENVIEASKAMLGEVEFFNRCCGDVIKRVAVPAFGAGVGGLRFDEVAKQMRQGWRKFHDHHEAIMNGFDMRKRYQT